MKSDDLKLIFDQTKEKMIDQWKNAYYEQSYTQVADLHQNVMVDKDVSKKQMAEILEGYQYEDF